MRSRRPLCEMRVRVRAYIGERSEPRTFGDEDDRFGFFFGWGSRIRVASTVPC